MDILSVTQLNRYVKSVLDSTPLLSEVYVRGEISSLNAHTASGHLYFSLKEGNTSVRAVMFKGNASHMRFTPQNGLSVLVRGQATIYERDGAFQLYVSDMQLDGVGAMYLAYEKLKVSLEAEGLFLEARKRPLPAMPKGIGVITSISGAALQDIIHVLKRRYPIGRLFVVPAYVQGDLAVSSLIEGLRILENQTDCDVIIIGRGGGSMEDLWAFNEETLVRAVANCTKPVISAVGHETDFTLCDFAADVRAPTPSAAAEIASPDFSGLPAQVKALQGRMQMSVYQILAGNRERVERLAASPALREANRLVIHNRERLNAVVHSMRQSYGRYIRQCRQQLAVQVAALDAKSPLKTIARGYTLTTDERGGLLDKSSPPVAGQAIYTRLSWGRVASNVTEVEVFGKDEETEL